MPEKNSCLNGIQTHDLSDIDTSAALLPTELSSQLGAEQHWYERSEVMGSNPIQA